MTDKIIGVVPARMAASRFPGKPLYPICGKPMVEHVYERAKMFTRWDVLCLATCDEEIRAFSEEKGYPVIMTADTHTRALTVSPRPPKSAAWTSPTMTLSSAFRATSR